MRLRFVAIWLLLFLLSLDLAAAVLRDAALGYAGVFLLSCFCGPPSLNQKWQRRMETRNRLSERPKGLASEQSVYNHNLTNISSPSLLTTVLSIVLTIITTLALTTLYSPSLTKMIQGESEACRGRRAKSPWWCPRTSINGRASSQSLYFEIPNPANKQLITLMVGPW